eukprot:TRINITY_DN67583_c9_g1_i1.p1 TRINITY_DN67583_c9_g1~~TRINITY_DN67583_c9_g1_i1.p1  ORF type:complete len:184 (-),score=11.36 TRINITY_DN67583_c9_g1_i1:234-785(-)
MSPTADATAGTVRTRHELLSMRRKLLQNGLLDKEPTHVALRLFDCTDLWIEVLDTQSVFPIGTFCEGEGMFWFNPDSGIVYQYVFGTFGEALHDNPGQGRPVVKIDYTQPSPLRTLCTKITEAEQQKWATDASCIASFDWETFLADRVPGTHPLDGPKSLQAYIRVLRNAKEGCIAPLFPRWL